MAVYGPFALVGSTGGHLHAVDVVTGTEVWRFRARGTVGDPSVVDGVVFIKGGTGSGARLYALEAHTGLELWSSVVGDTAGSGQLVHDEVVYTASGKSLAALHAKTGDLLWRFQLDGSFANIYSPPAFHNGTVYVGTSFSQSWLYAIDAMTGAERWRFKPGDSISGSPAVDSGIVFFGSNDHNIYAIDAATGAERWRLATPGEVRSSPAVADGVVYAAGGNTLFAVAVESGSVAWSFQAEEKIFGSPSLSGNTLYVADRTETLYALDAGTGHLLWRVLLGPPTSVSGVVTGKWTPYISDGMVYFGRRDGYLYAVE